MRFKTGLVLAALVWMSFSAWAADKSKKTPPVLAGVKTVQVDVTVVSDPQRVKEEHAPNLLADSLRNALRGADFEVGDAPIRAHIVLDEFTSGSTATRFLVGFGAGRSTVDCKLVLQDTEGKELYSKRIRVRGNLAWSPYQGNNTQRRQAVSSFEQRLLEELELLKGPGGTTMVAKESPAPAPKPAETKESGALSFTSDPAGAEIYVDGQLAGSTPCKLTVEAGKHTVKAIAKDYKEWSRELTVSNGSEVTVNAQLEKAAAAAGE